jgi:chemotaxis protein histidine kinase CheA
VFSLDFDFVYLPDSSVDSAAQRVSGRGVQLDAVRSLVSESRGAIKVHSVKRDVGLLDEELLLLAITEVCR